VELEVLDVDPLGAERLRDPREHARTVGHVHAQLMQLAGVGERALEHAPAVVGGLADPAGEEAGVALRQRGLDLLDPPPVLGQLAAAGGSLRDMTRVAGANPRIWVDIFLDNAGPLGDALAEHRRRIEQLEQALAANDAGMVARWIAEASGHRRRMLDEAYPDPGELQRVTAHVPDRPGVLAGITQALGAERINIEDFELRHFSPERGGVLTILVSGASEAERAARLLEAQGYGVSVSPVLE
jgi:hypothetical protein